MDAWSDAQQRFVSADELYEIPDPRNISFVCSECDAVLTPCSFKITNKRTAYFSARSGHGIGCPYNPINKKQKDDKKRESIDGLPIDHPSVLIFRAAPSGNIQINANGQNIEDYGDDDFEYYAQDDVHEKIYSSLKGIVEFYVKYHNRRNENLKIRGVADGSYADIFRLVRRPTYNDGKYSYPNHSSNNVYFGMLSMRTPMDEKDDRFIFHIYRKADDGVPDSKRPGEYLVEVYKNKFMHRHTEKGISRYRTEFQRIIDSKRQISGARIYIFFIGRQENDHNVFIVEDLRKMCIRCMSTEEQGNLHKRRGS